MQSKYFENEIVICNPDKGKGSYSSYSTNIEINPAGYAAILISNKRYEMKRRLEIVNSALPMHTLASQEGRSWWIMNACFCCLPNCLMCFVDCCLCCSDLIDCGKRLKGLRSEVTLSEEEDEALRNLLSSLETYFPKSAKKEKSISSSNFFDAKSDVSEIKRMAENTNTAINNIISSGATDKFTGFLRIIQAKIATDHQLTFNMAFDKKASDIALVSQAQSSVVMLREIPVLSQEEEKSEKPSGSSHAEIEKEGCTMS